MLQESNIEKNNNDSSLLSKLSLKDKLDSKKKGINSASCANLNKTGNFFN